MFFGNIGGSNRSFLYLFRQYLGSISAVTRQYLLNFSFFDPKKGPATSCFEANVRHISYCNKKGSQKPVNVRNQPDFKPMRPSVYSCPIFALKGLKLNDLNTNVKFYAEISSDRGWNDKWKITQCKVLYNSFWNGSILNGRLFDLVIWSYGVVWEVVFCMFRFYPHK